MRIMLGNVLDFVGNKVRKFIFRRLGVNRRRILAEYEILDMMEVDRFSNDDRDYITNAVMTALSRNFN